MENTDDAYGFPPFRYLAPALVVGGMGLRGAARGRASDPRVRVDRGAGPPARDAGLHLGRPHPDPRARGPRPALRLPGHRPRRRQELVTEAVSAARGPRFAARLGTATLLVALLLALAGPASAKPAPDTLIDSGPATSTSSTSASFTFHATQAGATFACTLDAGRRRPAPARRPYGGLVAGTHTFSVAATANGNTHSSPATFTWTIDTTAPTAPTAHPASTPTTTSVILPRPLGLTDPRRHRERRVPRRRASWSALGAVTSYTGTTVIAGSTHTYAVLARDAAGQISACSTSVSATTPTRRRCRTPSSTPPRLPRRQRRRAPVPRSPSTRAVRATYSCRLDGGRATSCTSPGPTTGLAEGTHTFTVAATVAGEAGPHARLGELGGRPAAPPCRATWPRRRPQARLGLTWSASTDNVGVTGYDVYRGGALLGSVGTATSSPT